jgi:hypothetical protein
MRIPPNATQTTGMAARNTAPVHDLCFAALYATSVKPAVALAPITGGLGLLMGAGSKDGARAFDQAASIVA